MCTERTTRYVTKLVPDKLYVLFNSNLECNHDPAHGDTLLQLSLQCTITIHKCRSGRTDYGHTNKPGPNWVPASISHIPAY